MGNDDAPANADPNSGTCTKTNSVRTNSQFDLRQNEKPRLE
jgi:hypothetical protein